MEELFTAHGEPRVYATEHFERWTSSFGAVEGRSTPPPTPALMPSSPVPAGKKGPSGAAARGITPVAVWGLGDSCNHHIGSAGFPAALHPPSPGVFHPSSIPIHQTGVGGDNSGSSERRQAPFILLCKGTNRYMHDILWMGCSRLVICLSATEASVVAVRQAWEGSVSPIDNKSKLASEEFGNGSSTISPANVTIIMVEPTNPSASGGQDILGGGATPLGRQSPRDGSLLNLSGTVTPSRVVGVNRSFHPPASGPFTTSTGTMGNTPTSFLATELKHLFQPRASYVRVVVTSGAEFATTLNEAIEGTTQKRLRADLPPFSPFQWWQLMISFARDGHAKLASSCVGALKQKETEKAASKAAQEYEQFTTSAVTAEGGSWYGSQALLKLHNEAKGAVMRDFRSQLAPFGTVDVEDLLGTLLSSLQRTKHSLKRSAQTEAEQLITELLDPLSKQLLHNGAAGDPTLLVLQEWQDSMSHIVQRFSEQGPPDSTIRNAVLLDVLLQWYIPNTTVVHNACQQRSVAQHDKLQTALSEAETQRNALEKENERLLQSLDETQRRVLSREKLLETLLSALDRFVEGTADQVGQSVGVVQSALKSAVADRFLEQNLSTEDLSSGSAAPSLPKGGDDTLAAYFAATTASRQHLLQSLEQQLSQLQEECGSFVSSVNKTVTASDNELAAERAAAHNSSGVHAVRQATLNESMEAILSSGPALTLAASKKPQVHADDKKPGRSLLHVVPSPERVSSTEEITLVQHGDGSTDASRQRAGLFWPVGISRNVAGDSATPHPSVSMEEVQELKQGLFDAQQRCEHEEKVAAEANQRYEGMKEELAELMQRLRDSTTELCRLQEQLAIVLDEKHHLEAEVQSLHGVRDANTKLSRELADVKHREAQLASALTTVEAERDSYFVEKERVGGELAQAKTQVESLAEDLARVSKSHDENIAHLQALEQSFQELCDAKHDLASRYDGLQTDFERAQRQIEGLKHDWSVAQTHSDDLLEQLTRERQERDEAVHRYEANIAELMYVKDTAVADFEKQKVEVERLAKELDATESDLSTTKEQADCLRNALATSQGEVSTYRDQLANSEQQLLQQQNDNQLLRLQVSQLNEAASSWKSRHDHLQQELAGAKENELALHQHVQRLDARAAESRRLVDAAPNSTVLTPGNRSSPMRSAPYSTATGVSLFPGGTVSPHRGYRHPLTPVTVQPAPVSPLKVGGRLMPRPIDPHVAALQQLESSAAKIRNQTPRPGSPQPVALSDLMVNMPTETLLPGGNVFSVVDQHQPSC